MRRIVALVAMLVAIAAANCFAASADEAPVPKLTAHVVDQAGLLSPAQRDALDAKLRAFEAAHGSQIAVLTMPTLKGESIEDFSTRVTDQWQLGRKGVDDGVLLLVAKEEHGIRIQTGRGVQGTLTDALSKRIISEFITPRFRAGDFAGGLDAGVDAIMKAVEGEDLPLPAKAPVPRSSASYSDFVFLAFFLVPIVAMILRSVAGRLVGAGLTSAITGLAAWLVLGSIALGVLAFVFTFVLALFSGLRVTPPMGPGRWGGGWGGGGFGGGLGGGFGGGGGGFSGGGGTFDGGGASGKW